MNEVERRLRMDRVKGIPEPPDFRYTEAAIRRRLGQAQAQEPESEPESEPGARFGEWWVAGAAIGLVILLGYFLMSLGTWWLAVLPLTVLPLTPILLKRERERS